MNLSSSNFLMKHKLFSASRFFSIEHQLQKIGIPPRTSVKISRILGVLYAKPNRPEYSVNKAGNRLVCSPGAQTDMIRYGYFLLTSNIVTDFGKSGLNFGETFCACYILLDKLSTSAILNPAICVLSALDNLTMRKPQT